MLRDLSIKQAIAFWFKLTPHLNQKAHGKKLLDSKLEAPYMLSLSIARERRPFNERIQRHILEADVESAVFERSGWQEMIGTIEAGEIEAVIVKDMSRLGGDYLKVGFYAEVMFSEKGICFLTVKNGMDSNNQMGSDFTPFLNIINERYAKGTRKKIRSKMENKGFLGEHLNTPPYDYIADPTDRKKRQHQS